jgi:hypothetical protein
MQRYTLHFYWIVGGTRVMAQERNQGDHKGITIRPTGSFNSPIQYDTNRVELLDVLRGNDDEEQKITALFAPGQSNIDDLIDISKEMVKTPQYVIFPSDIDCRKIQKCIINFNHTQWKNGPSGKKAQYVLWAAYSLFFHYNKRTIHDRVPFVLMVPYNSFINMFARTAAINFPRLLQELLKEFQEIPLVEIHFKKESATNYELKYMALVEHVETTEDRHVWRRTRMLYEEKGYKHKNLDIVR